MSYKPLISIITATFNAQNDIEACIKSVISQTYTNIEFIIVDGGSTDSTLEIIKKYEKYISICISEKDNGIYDAWNKGINLATGDWISFLGADDIYMSDAIENYVHCLDELDNSKLDIISSRVKLIDINGNVLRIIGENWRWKSFKRYMCTAHVGSLHSKYFFKKYGLYNISYKIVGDYEILLRANQFLKAAYLDKVTVKMKLGGISNLNNRAISEAYRAKIENKSCNLLTAKYDLFKANFIFYTRKFLNKV